MWAEVAHCLETAVADKVAPAMVALAWREDNIFTHAAGQCATHTVFDLASLTKPLAATVLALACPVPWSANLQQIWGAQAPPDKRHITIEQLLCHCSGLPAWQPYYEILRATPPAEHNAALKRLILQEPLAYPTASQAVYSDLGFMLLGLILQEHYACRLDSALQNIYQRLAIDNAPFYLPPGAAVGDNVAGVGAQPWLERTRIVGQVEDENAWALQGIAPHAGLFGTAAMVKEVLQKAFQQKAAQTLWPAARLNKIYTRDCTTPNSTRTAGFDTPDGPNSSAGNNYPPGLIGHLGFTGVSCWYQPQQDMGAILLTNRVAFGRDNWKIRQLRPKLHNLLWPLLTKGN